MQIHLLGNWNGNRNDTSGMGRNGNIILMAEVAAQSTHLAQAGLAVFMFKVNNNGRLTCDQKLVESSLIYRTEPKQNRVCQKTVSSQSLSCQSGKPETLRDVTEGERVGAIMPCSGSSSRDVWLCQVEYYMSSSTLSSPGGRVFDVDQLSGDVTVVGRVDREQVPVYRLLVSARDRGGGGGQSTRSADAIVVVRVTDENDNVPTISINTLLQVQSSGEGGRSQVRKGFFREDVEDRSP